jgi:hypothetical protein
MIPALIGPLGHSITQHGKSGRFGQWITTGRQPRDIRIHGPAYTTV